MADRGLQAYAVPSARAGQQPDPSARRDALAGLLAAGFLVAVVAVVLLIILAAPEYARPAPGAAAAPDASSEPSPEASAVPLAVAPPAPETVPPDELKGYRWPVRGGMVHSYYQADPTGQFVIKGRRVHAGLLITWWEGAPVKAAHKGTVIAAGRRWADHLGYEGSLEKVYRKLERRKEKPTLGIVVDDGNGYLSVYSALGDVRVEVGDQVKPGRVIGTMGRSEGLQMMRYQLVRTDGPMLKVHKSYRDRGYPHYVRELVDPLVALKPDAVRKPDAKTKPDTVKRVPPKDPPRLSDDYGLAE